jgi:hypothetical protein
MELLSDLQPPLCILRFLSFLPVSDVCPPPGQFISWLFLNSGNTLFGGGGETLNSVSSAHVNPSIWLCFLAVWGHCMGFQLVVSALMESHLGIDL